MAILLFILLFFISPLCYAEDDAKGEAGQEVNGFSLVQFEDGGAKKWELNGKSADVHEGRVTVDEVSAVLYGEGSAVKLKAKEGSLDRSENIVLLENDVVAKITDGTRLSTDRLQWDVRNKDVFTDAGMSIKKSDFEVSGKGAYVDLEAKKAELRNEVTANMRSSAPGFLEDANGEPRTTITCDGPLEIDYVKNQAVFRNNVKVEDAQADIYADRIDVYFNQETKRIRLVAARGNVRIVNKDSISYCEKAIYLVEHGRLILPRRPKLVIQGQGSKKF